MIVPMMNDEEVYAHLREDLAYLWSQPVSDKYKKKFRRGCLQSNKYPYTKIFRNVTRQNNEFWLILRALKRGMHSNPLTTIVTTYRKKEGLYMILFSVDSENRNAMTVYSPHFFERYKERVLKNEQIGIKELMIRFVSDGIGSVYVFIDEHMHEVSAQICPDEDVDCVGYDGSGLMFAKRHKDMIVVKTIISEDMLKPTQLKVFDGLVKLWQSQYQSSLDSHG